MSVFGYEFDDIKIKYDRPILTKFPVPSIIYETQ